MAVDASQQAATEVAGASVSPLRFLVKFIPGIAVILDSAYLLAAGFATFDALVFYSYKSAGTYYSAICFVWLVTVSLQYFGGLYRVDFIVSPLRAANRVFVSVATAFILMLAAAFSLKVSVELSRAWVATFFVGSFIGLLALKELVAVGLSSLSNRQLMSRRALIIGDDHYIKRLLEHIEGAKPRFMAVSGVFAGNFVGTEGQIASKPLRNRLEDLIKSFRTSAADDIIIALPWSAETEISGIIERLRELPVNVYLGSDLVGYRNELRNVPDHYSDMPMFEVVGKPLSGWDVVLKTIEDYVLSLAILLLISPLLLVVAIAIKFDSPGPVFFLQKRHGFNNKTFRIIKFRTMKVEDGPPEKTLQATRDDDRVTKLGRFLRKTSIDELPQLFNVINGTMSLVGPRPHAIDHNEDYSRRIRGYFGRHRMKPGMTGLAQVKGYRGVTDTIDKMENRVKYDIIYTDNWSLMLDIKILMKTALVCLLGKNAH
jgi:putative colanic acid biosysnthesis UDP-glucose lipid carrier transferase